MATQECFPPIMSPLPNSHVSAFPFNPIFLFSAGIDVHLCPVCVQLCPLYILLKPDDLFGLYKLVNKLTKRERVKSFTRTQS